MKDNFMLCSLNFKNADFIRPPRIFYSTSPSSAPTWLPAHLYLPHLILLWASLLPCLAACPQTLDQYSFFLGLSQGQVPLASQNGADNSKCSISQVSSSHTHTEKPSYLKKYIFTAWVSRGWLCIWGKVSTQLLRSQEVALSVLLESLQPCFPLMKRFSQVSASMLQSSLYPITFTSSEPNSWQRAMHSKFFYWTLTLPYALLVTQVSHHSFSRVI